MELMTFKCTRGAVQKITVKFVVLAQTVFRVRQELSTNFTDFQCLNFSTDFLSILGLSTPDDRCKH